MVLTILLLLVNEQEKPSKPGSIPMIQALFPMTKEEPCSIPLVVFAFSSAVSLSDCSDLYKAGCIVRYSQAAESIIKKTPDAGVFCLFILLHRILFHDNTDGAHAASAPSCEDGCCPV